MSNKTSIILLAAGKGTRMNSELPKVLHKLKDKELVKYVLDNAFKLNPKEIIVVVGYKKELVINALSGYEVKFAEQSEQLGTGHAVKCALPLVNDDSENILVLYGDMPMITESTLEKMIDSHSTNQSKITILTGKSEYYLKYGRIIRNADNEIERIVEEKDASEEEKKIRELNLGICLFHKTELVNSINEITDNNQSHEYYLTDLIKILRDKGHKVNSYMTENSLEVLGVNTSDELERIEKI